MAGKMINIRYIHVDILYFYVMGNESNEKRSQALLVFFEKEFNGKLDPTFDFCCGEKK
jgi:hypothetical protein